MVSPRDTAAKLNEPTDKLLRLTIDTLSNLKVETRGEPLKTSVMWYIIDERDKVYVTRNKNPAKDDETLAVRNQLLAERVSLLRMDGQMMSHYPS